MEQDSAIAQCPHCKTRVMFMTDTCPSCASDRNASLSKQQTAELESHSERSGQQMNKSKRSMLLALLLLVGLAAIAGLLAVPLLKRSSAGSDAKRKANAISLGVRSVVVAQNGMWHIGGQSLMALNPDDGFSVGQPRPNPPTIWIFRDKRSLTVAPGEASGLEVGVAYRQRDNESGSSLRRVCIVDLSLPDEALFEEFGVSSR